MVFISILLVKEVVEGFGSDDVLVVDLLDFLRSSSLSLCIASVLDLDLLAVARKFQTLII